eukprot:666110-Hanusia_phi.AAC.1
MGPVGRPCRDASVTRMNFGRSTGWQLLSPGATDGTGPGGARRGARLRNLGALPVTRLEASAESSLGLGRVTRTIQASKAAAGPLWARRSNFWQSRLRRVEESIIGWKVCQLAQWSLGASTLGYRRRSAPARKFEVRKFEV